MAPKIDPTSDATLMQRYDEMYNNSPSFKSMLHNVVTASRSLKLVSAPRVGDASYNESAHTIEVCLNNTNGAKTATEIRDDIFFELHNAKRAMAFADIAGAKGYNRASLVHDVRKAAGYALAVEWAEWNNVAECVILNDTVNFEAGAAGPLLHVPSPFRGSFTTGGANWMKFTKYLDDQVASGHTGHYDDAATPGGTWIGPKILNQASQQSGAAVEIYANELNPAIGFAPKLNYRGNPFLWDLVRSMRLS
jgi:hypothetical protein